MRKLLAIALLLLAGSALADVLLKQAGTTIGPVTSLSCQTDAGLFCARGTLSVGNIRCNAASSAEPGCLVPGAQTIPTGDKTFVSPVRIAAVSHASLEACDGSHLGNHQSCSTHNADVFCDGTNNIERNGTSATEQSLASVYVNGIPQTLIGNQFTCQSACTVTAIEGTWGTGSTSDGGTFVVRITDGSNNCDCTQPCSSPTTRCTPSGSCSFSAGSTLTPKRASTTCTVNPYVGGNLTVKGTTP